MLRKYVSPYLEELTNEIAGALANAGIKPNHLTLLGGGVSLLAGMAYGLHLFFFGAMLLASSGICDMLDGALARQNAQTSSFGGFLDSVVDRYADFFIFAGILIHYINHLQFGVAILVLVVIIGSFLTSYTKARMECFPVKCDAGLVERPERLIIIFIGSFFNLMIPALWILAIFSNITALQRIWFASEKLR
ncbi:MAG: CDP-alcohol phosphatidyltransferase family protein [Candidatus Omnitrophica bacterium]|nr:CDP-alcohol phosphatidyltransferase family protein [Candidatus Omnitrophota bacterium]